MIVCHVCTVPRYLGITPRYLGIFFFVSFFLFLFFCVFFNLCLIFVYLGYSPSCLSGALNVNDQSANRRIRPAIHQRRKEYESKWHSFESDLNANGIDHLFCHTKTGKHKAPSQWDMVPIVVEVYEELREDATFKESIKKDFFRCGYGLPDHVSAYDDYYLKHLFENITNENSLLGQVSQILRNAVA